VYRTLHSPQFGILKPVPLTVSYTGLLFRQPLAYLPRQLKGRSGKETLPDARVDADSTVMALSIATGVTEAIMVMSGRP
jgi:hypothetical protein